MCEVVIFYKEMEQGKGWRVMEEGIILNITQAVLRG